MVQRLVIFLLFTLMACGTRTHCGRSVGPLINSLYNYNINNLIETWLNPLHSSGSHWGWFVVLGYPRDSL